MEAPQVIVESGSQVAINAITGWNQTPKLFGNLVIDIKDIATCIRIFTLYIVVGKSMFLLIA